MAKSVELSLGELLLKNKKTIAIAESCTGGLISNTITNVPGSSAYFLGGVIAYSNQAKIQILKIPEGIIQNEGAVTRDCALAMARNARKIFCGDIGVGVTGIAGPGGGAPGKPVGSVYIAVTDGFKTLCKLFKFDGARDQVKQKASQSALKMVKELFFS